MSERPCFSWPPWEFLYRGHFACQQAPGLLPDGLCPRGLNTCSQNLSAARDVRPGYCAGRFDGEVPISEDALSVYKATSPQPRELAAPAEPARRIIPGLAFPGAARTAWSVRPDSRPGQGGRSLGLGVVSLSSDMDCLQLVPRRCPYSPGQAGNPGRPSPAEVPDEVGTTAEADTLCWPWPRDSSDKSRGQRHR
jgi:hypothetical protein